MGIRQKESDFTFLAKMKFVPNIDGIDAGISLFQKDDNYITFTVEYFKGDYYLKLILKEKGLSSAIVQRTPIKSYNGSITFKIISEKNSYNIYYAIGNKKTYTLFEKISPIHLVSKGYTGAYLGIYCTSNGKKASEFADFEIIEYY